MVHTVSKVQASRGFILFDAHELSCVIYLSRGSQPMLGRQVATAFKGGVKFLKAEVEGLHYTRGVLCGACQQRLSRNRNEVNPRLCLVGV